MELPSLDLYRRSPFQFFSGIRLKGKNFALPVITSYSIHYTKLYEGDYSGAAVIFGATGGVMEAAIRTVHKVVTGKEIEQIDYKAVRGLENTREAEVDLGAGGKVKVAVVHTLKAAGELVRNIKEGKADYQFVEVMACPGGCMCGGGQPRVKHAYQSARMERMKGLYDIDRTRKIRQSHNNPMIQKIYAEYLEEPMGHKSHKLLHTSYQDHKRMLKYTMKDIWEEIENR